jgi:imidazole glycerol phosphate synthase, glutamine amidotransferase subunit
MSALAKNTVVVDYGLGNLHNLKHTLDYLKIGATISNRSEEILNAKRIILPGVGAFAAGMAELKKKGLVEILNDYVETGKPLLGICLGMQLLMTSSNEYGNHKGLGYVKGKVLPFNSFYKNKIKFKVPQIGWNNISFNSKNKIEIKYICKWTI